MARAGEFTLIADFLDAFPRARVPLGPGDDCAILAPARRPLCVTTDALVEDVHFRRAAFRPEDIGHKALAVNLSDLAAMGATPRWFVCALALPPAFPRAHLRRLARGMSALARAHALALVGGNFSRARELSLTLTVAGELQGPALTRAGGRPGDLLYVSGTLGEARLGLRDLAAGRRASAAARRQRRPEPRLALGRLAARWARAGMDLSDGLAQDLGHLCAASRCGAEVQLACLPLSPRVRRELGPWEALAGGEDYELLLALPPARAASFERACRRAGHRLTRVGRLTSGRARVVLDPAGRRLLPPGGFDHFGPPV